MVTRTFKRETFTIKGINKNDEIETFELELWEHEKPSGKRKLTEMLTCECEKRGLELFKANVTNVFEQVRGVDENTFFNNSVIVER
jgi:hypothetical protein